MKKNKAKNKSKLALLSLAVAIPMATTGIAFSTVNPMQTQAASNAVSYKNGYVQEVSLSNGNFNSSSTTTLISSPSGWAKQISDKKTTAGVINTGSSFQRYMTSTYYLSKNPGTDGSDSQILMINSKTGTSDDSAVAKEGFRSNSVSLAANSYYSFKVAFKSTKNFESVTDYVVTGKISEEDFKIGNDTFKSKGFKLDEQGEIANEYISFTYHNRSYYLLKALDKENTTTVNGQNGEDLKDATVFYEDDNFVGIIYGEDQKPVYVKKSEIERTENALKVNVKNGTTAYSCKNITFEPNQDDPSTGMYKVAANTDYFNSKTSHNPLNAEARGSIYLDGLKDADGKAVKADYVGVTSSQWTSFTFFVATGSESQTVNLELWLGARSGNKNLLSSGAVFFDNVRINQYSENNFWKAYQANFDNAYDISYDNGTSEHQICTQLFDFRKSKALDEKTLSVSDDEVTDFNFDFEEGVYNDDPTTLKNWKKDEGSFGNARVFDANDDLAFKAATGYDFVGYDLSCDVNLEETDESTPRLKVVASTPNKYLLGLWTKNNSVKVTSKEIKIESQKIYKISATYKVSAISSGNAYMFVKENDTLIKDLYTPAAETASGALSNSNSSNNFANNFSTVEFFVKGGMFYDSSVSVSLGLGKSDEASTGCIVFDNVKVEYATSEEYANATNKLQLGTSADSTTVTNGEFDLVDVKEGDDGLLTPQNWTITKGKGTTFSGVINTSKDKFDSYKKKFDTYQTENPGYETNNPYYWTTYPNPGNAYNDSYPGNVLMLANVSKTWQRLKSESFDISTQASSETDASDQKLSFMYKTLSNEKGMKVSLFTDNGMKLFEKSGLSSSTWQEFSVYFKAFPGATKVYVQIELGSEEEGATGAIYLDSFDLQSENVPSAGVQNVVDMSNFGLNLPTFSVPSKAEGQNLALTSDSTAPFKGSVTSSTEGGVVKGGIVKGSFFQQGSKYYVEDAQDKNFFFFTVGGVGAYAIDSNFNIDLESGSYYVLSFKAKSFFNYLNDDVSLDDKKTYDYGFTIGLTGFDYMSNVISNEEFKEYKLFINASEAKTTQLHMALICDSAETSGSLAIYDLDLQKSTEDEFKEAQKATNEKNYDVNSSNMFASNASDNTSDEDTSQDSSEGEESGSGEDFNWLLIPTLITALAIVIAVVGYFLRKLKIKKIQIKRKNSYDRKTSANVDLIKRKAAKERDEELKALETSKAKFEAELEKLETAHKEKIVELRSKDTKSVSKETDKQFKVFAKKRTVIAEKIDVLQKQIEETNSPEHLLSLERQIFAEQEAERRKLQKSQNKNKKEVASSEETPEKAGKKKK